jgi:hypothetical protein
MVREHVDTSLPRVVVLLDDRAGAHRRGADGESTFEAACEAAASVIVAAVREDIHVELRLVSGVAAGTGQVEVGPLLDLLAEASLVREPRRGVPRGGGRGLVREQVPGEVSVTGSGSGAGAGSGSEDGAGWTPPPPELLRTAVERLRVRRVGDTLLFLTGPPDEDDLGVLAGLRGAYPSIIAGVFGPVEGGLATTAGLLVVGAANGADFAAACDGVRAW